jgi:glycosyltransferase involved in cell wall biosynthesis
VTTVSVAMAIHDGARFLEPQLRSLVAQRRPPDEVVVCDDASQDGGAELCTAILSGTGIALVLLRNERSIGPYASFSRALAATGGDFVCLCDQDDVWYPDKIAEATAYLSARPAVSAVVHDVDICRSDLIPVGQTKFERMAALGLPPEGNVTGMSTATRRAVVDAAFPLPDPSATSHDAWLHWVAGHLGERHVLEQRLAAFRRHEGNVTKDLLVNRGVRVDRRPRFHAVGQLWRARDAGARVAQARRLAALEIEWLAAARARGLVAAERADAGLAGAQGRLRALDEIEAIATLGAPARWLRAAAGRRAWRPHVALFGPSLVVGALLYGTGRQARTVNR